MRPVAHISSLMSASNGETRAARQSWRLTVVAVLVAVCGRKTLNWYSWRPCRPIAMSPPGKTDGRAADGERRRAVGRHVTPTPTSPVGAERLRGLPARWLLARSPIARAGEATGLLWAREQRDACWEAREVALSLWRRVLGWCGGDLVATHGDMCRSGRRSCRVSTVTVTVPPTERTIPFS